MKKILVGLLAMTSVSTFASLPKVVVAFINQSGDYTSIYNGKETRESKTVCTIEANDSVITIEAGAYFAPIANFEGAVKETDSSGRVSFKLKDNGRRGPGASVCGDSTPLTKYKKTVEIEGNTLAIRQVYRCLLSKRELVEKCVIK